MAEGDKTRTRGPGGTTQTTTPASKEGPSAGDLDLEALQMKARSMLPVAVLDGKQSMLIQTIQSLFIMENGCIQPPQGGPEIKYLCRKECLGRKA